MKTLTLNKSKWICGDPEFNSNSKNCLGKGYTRLLNKEGYMCCLGQFSLQLNPDIKEDNLFGRIYPTQVNVKIPLLSYHKGYIKNTNLTYKAMEINDDTKTTVKEKIKLLKELFAKKGYKIKVI